MEKTKNKKRVVLVIVFLILLAIYVAITVRGKYLQTLEIGEQYVEVFKQNIKYKVGVVLVNFAILYIATYITTRFIKRGLKKFFDDDKKKMPKLPNKSISLILSVVISLISSNFITEKIMLALNTAWFGIYNPIFNMDIGYYMFQKPVIEAIIIYFIALLAIYSIYIAVYYIIVFNKYFEKGIDRATLKKNTFIKQLGVNIILAVLGIAAITLVKVQDVVNTKFLTLSDGTGLYGAGLIEATIKTWGYRIFAFIILFASIMAMINFKKENFKKIMTWLCVIPGYLVVLFVVMLGFDLIYVNSNELDKEKKYIEKNIEFTKSAYGINVDEIEIENSGTITKGEVNKNQEVISNVNILNEDNVLENLEQYQTNSGYYSYTTTKPEIYNIDGKEKLVYISPREIVSNDTRTYNNKTYEYTHGYGAIITSATTTDEIGNIKYMQKDFNSSEIISLSQPRIYFGLETNSTVVTNSKDKKEFDYPSTTSTKAENIENVYDGQAGLSLNFFDRLVLAIKEGDLKLAFSSNVTAESNILINRNIIERAKTLMPYISYDENPYLVVDENGKLLWVLDGYTTSDYYPFSQKITLNDESVLNKEQINYIRNSVKVLIDAYDGTIKFYITDRNDPIIMAYQKMYKDLFVDKDEAIPENISGQFIYPEYLYKIQAEVIKRYHNIQTDVLYRGDDIWDIATHNSTKVTNKVGVELSPYYTMVKTIDNDNYNLGLVLPYTPYNKQNLTSYLIGSYENGEAKLVLYKYPSDSNILGTMQLDTQIEQDKTISKELEALNITGTKLLRDMIVVPINNSLLYVEPIYQQYMNEENSTPILKKVIVASGNKVAIGNNISEALSNLVSQSAVDIEIEDTETIEGLIQAIIKTNSNLKKSNSNNNWEMVGKDMTKLQELITKLEKLQNQNNKTKKESVVQNSENIQNNE